MAGGTCGTPVGVLTRLVQAKRPSGQKGGWHTDTRLDALDDSGTPIGVLTKFSQVKRPSVGPKGTDGTPTLAFESQWPTTKAALRRFASRVR